MPPNGVGSDVWTIAETGYMNSMSRRSNSDASAGGDGRARADRVTVVITGHLGSRRTQVGLMLARHCHRPCVDTAHAAHGDPTHVPSVSDDPTTVAERRWFESVTALDQDHHRVVVAPCSVVESLPDMTNRSNLWVAWLDAPTDELIEHARADAPDLDIDALRVHAESARVPTSHCDAIIDVTDRTIDQIVQDLADRFSEQRARREVSPTATPG